MSGKTLEGGCLCGAVRYQVSGEPVVTGHCHCEHCRKASGAGHATFAAFPENAVKMTGTLKTFRIRGDSGMMAARSFCPECGSWVAGHPESAPGLVAITVATLDDPEALAPQMRFYDKRRISWDTVDPALPAFAAMPPTPG
jgi:hypothetical protein